MPAYHMNKMHWITVLLDGTVPEKRVLELIDITDYANLIAKALPKSILLNTNGDKLNSMVIGWDIAVRSGGVRLSMCMSGRAGTQRGSLARPVSSQSVCHLTSRTPRLTGSVAGSPGTISI